jgi:hypothetical protein
MDDVLPTVVSRCQVLPLRDELIPTRSIELGLMSAKHDIQSEIPPSLKDLNSRLPTLKRRSAALELIEITRQFLELTSEDTDPEFAIDFLISEEVARYGVQTIQDKNLCHYLNALIQLGEHTKLMIEQYVTLKSVIESFFLSWNKLKIDCGFW